MPTDPTLATRIAEVREAYAEVATDAALPLRYDLKEGAIYDARHDLVLDLVAATEFNPRPLHRIVTVLNNLPALLAALEERTEALGKIFEAHRESGAFNNWECDYGFTLGECPPDNRCVPCIVQRASNDEKARAALATPVLSPHSDGST